MKGSKVHLQDAHQNQDSEASVACILWDWHAKHLITAGADNTILIHSYPSTSSSKPITLRHHKGAVTALAINSNVKSLASGSVDHSVKLYSYPGGEFQSNVTRFTLPIRSLAFNKSGELLAAAGDDEGIKLISTIDSSIARVLKGHNGPVTSLSFDPKNEFLASADSDGTVIYWQLSTGKIVHTLKKIAPNTNSNPAASLNQISWRPDGEMLAVPGRKSEVSMYDRDTAEKLFSLKGGHSDTICFLAWSPNGKYIATAGADRQVMVWDADRRQDIDRQRFDNPICSVAWKPSDNALAVIDVLGRFGVWESPIASHMKSPADGAERYENMEDEDSFMAGYKEELDDSVSGSLDGIGNDDDDDDDMGKIPRKILQKKPSVKVEKGKEESNAKVLKSGQDSFKVKSAMQETFQPGATPRQSGKRNFLAYNMLGCVITFENDGFSHIEVDFHDIGRGRVPSMTDYFGFTIASLSESGSIFGSPQKGEKNPSTLMYRPFSSWANNSEWSMRFPMGEEVKAVALGSGWVAAVTSLNFLRVFSEGGMQKFVLCLDGPVVTAAGHGNLLVVVSHASNPLLSGEQVLNFTVYNISEKTCPLSGRLPLSPGSHLTWLGFSEEGLLSSYDSEGNLRVFTNEYNGCWVPIFSAARERKSETESIWMVGLNSTEVFCVVCKLPDTYPQVAPKPVLSVLNLSLPLACSDLGADDLENEYLRGSLLLSQMQKKAEDAAACGHESNMEEDSIFKMEAALDRCLLRLIANCCKGDKLVRATELARLLSLEKSLQGAIKLVSAMKLPMLAERFNTILEEKILQENMETISYKRLASEVQDMETTISNVKQVSYKANLGDNPALSNRQAEPKYSSPAFSKPDTRIEVDNSEAITKGHGTSAENGNLKNADAEVQPTIHNDSIQKPSNPFAKGSSTSANHAVQRNASLLSSIKQMKTATENEGKRKERAGSGSLPQKPAKQKKIS